MRRRKIAHYLFRYRLIGKCSEMSWWFMKNKIAKSHFYVWYLGSREADGVRGSAVVLPAMRHLLKESFQKTPSKATVQISHKGLKLVQSVPSMSKSGKVKMQMVKFQIAANCITYSVTGKLPFDDVVGVIMLVLNPEIQSPMHVHCYRCDSAETAQIMHANIQILLARPENQRAIMELEQRLFLSGLLVPRTINHRAAPSYSIPGPCEEEYRDVSLRRRIEKERNMKREEDRHSSVVSELRSKMASTGDLTRVGTSGFEPTNWRKTNISMNELNKIDSPNTMHKLRVFGDTLVRPEKKSHSMDNINHPVVSTDLRGGSHTSRRFPRTSVIDPFGQSYERSLHMSEGARTNPRHDRNKSFQCHL